MAGWLTGGDSPESRAIETHHDVYSSGYILHTSGEIEVRDQLEFEAKALAAHKSERNTFLAIGLGSCSIKIKRGRCLSLEDARTDASVTWPGYRFN